MKDQFRDLLHQYKVEAFKISHSDEHVRESTEDILKFTEEALNNTYNYHFRRNPNPERFDTFKMIKNYTLEALLPPVVEKLVRRISVLEKQQAEMVKLVDRMLDAMSAEAADRNAG